MLPCTGRFHAGFAHPALVLDTFAWRLIARIEPVEAHRQSGCNCETNCRLSHASYSLVGEQTVAEPAMSQPLTDATHLSRRERECLELCRQAVEVSEWCADECAGLDGMTECVRHCRDVTDVASLHCKLLARGSPHREALAGLCATVCRECAEECRQHDHDHCRTCTEVLSECAEVCESMVK